MSMHPLSFARFPFAFHSLFTCFSSAFHSFRAMRVQGLF
ncbi:conserved hypothetical protein [Burkholderia mallei PRL-20]|uniref:Uncharacterized protein n=1 Tax=Burkholderia mallei (strain NCTC 10229) TaxID=412022 RepID=A2SA91_BURM9|nr:hypothetical protein BMASAVP1_A2372 [Burkholderia mallei SAVP1]ABN01274.1 hypothetical protein BMA10229_A2914 [Burkholderia mallei NCTC 10229]ABO05240.1 hypothetical protein BMA10247_1687 [Burkholderia mallei NCTC 10247]EES42877.1 conserved hypothetical protein [Burkholderia mallei PRL-20]